MDNRRGEPSTEVASREASLQVRSVSLDVSGGPDAGRTAHVQGPTFIVGSGEGADLRLTDPTVSREHLRIALSPQGVHIRDEGSKNGTWCAGMRITEALLTTGAVLELGDTRVTLRIDAQPVVLPLSTETSFGDAIGVSPAMRHLFALLERAARSDVPVLLEGESGVGKELLARAVHARSARSEGPFVAVNCGAIPAGLIEAELFGHERGAFTGASAAHRGVFEQAHGGTLFLDEIGELALALQPKLLRALEEQEVRPLGGTSARRVDVRVIAATNRRLSEAVRKDEFRSDLFYRLAVARVTIPPLRDRREDIVPIARALLRSVSGNPAAELSPELAQILTTYTWPGNVRELRNVIQRYALLEVRDAGSLLDEMSTLGGARDAEELSLLSYHDARQRVLDRFERSYLPKVLERAGGIAPRAAELAQVSRSTFYRMLERIRGEHGDAD